MPTRRPGIDPRFRVKAEDIRYVGGACDPLLRQVVIVMQGE